MASIPSRACMTCVEVVFTLIELKQQENPTEHRAIFSANKRASNIRRSLSAHSSARCMCMYNKLPVFVCVECNDLNLWDHEASRPKKYQKAEGQRLMQLHKGFQIRYASLIRDLQLSDISEVVTAAQSSQKQGNPNGVSNSLTFEEISELVSYNPILDTFNLNNIAGETLDYFTEKDEENGYDD